VTVCSWQLLTHGTALLLSLMRRLQMNTVMAWSKRDWLKAHPRFEEWCQAYKRSQQQQQQQPGELPSPERQLSRQQQVALLQQIH
jgi:hypothetical protein